MKLAELISSQQLTFERYIMKLLLTAIGLVLALAIPISAQAEITVATDDGSGTACSTIFAGQTIDVGQVCVTATVDGLCVEYSTTGDWYIAETHLWAGQNISEMPQNKKGNPKIGQFPYGQSPLAPETQIYEVCIPYAELGLTAEMICAADQLVLFAAHCSVYRVVGGEVVQTETGWSDGDPIVDKGPWGTFGNVTLTCDAGPEPPKYGDCETAFAFGSTELDDIEDLSNPGTFITNRWGWQVGPLEVGDTLVTQIYTGAGQNDLTKGTYVGDLELSYNGVDFTATYVMIDGFVMTETHVYVGHDNIQTGAPGLFGNQHESLEATVDEYVIGVESPGDPVYVVAHAVVCEIIE